MMGKQKMHLVGTLVSGNLMVTGLRANRGAVLRALPGSDIAIR